MKNLVDASCSIPRPRHLPDQGETRLLEVLTEARRRGFLGPRPVEEHLDHAGRFLLGVSSPPARSLDLGAGGGVPGLVLALAWPESEWVLLDVNVRRTGFLREAIVALGIQERASVVRARAEEAGREPALRGQFDLVTARSFGPPATTAECAASFLRVRGVLLVSEPPVSVERWPAEGLAVLGLTAEARSHGIQRLVLTAPLNARFPRTAAGMQRRPLF